MSHTALMTPKIVAALAADFDRRLRAELTPSQYKQACEDNRAETYYGICHSHDQCDANMVMDEAFTAIVGRTSDVSSQDDSDLWTRGWDWWRMTICPSPNGALVAAVIDCIGATSVILCPTCAAHCTGELYRMIDEREVISEGHDPADLICEVCGKPCGGERTEPSPVVCVDCGWDLTDSAPEILTAKRPRCTVHREERGIR